MPPWPISRINLYGPMRSPGLLLLVGRTSGEADVTSPAAYSIAGVSRNCAASVVGGDQGLQPRAEDRVAGARAIERRGARRRLEVQHLVEDRLDSGPFLRGESVGMTVLSRDLESPETETLAPSATRA